MGEVEQDMVGLALVPWIACTRCGRVLMCPCPRRLGRPLLPRYYVITTSNRAIALRLFPAGSAAAAFAAIGQHAQDNGRRLCAASPQNPAMDPHGHATPRCRSWAQLAPVQ